MPNFDTLTTDRPAPLRRAGVDQDDRVVTLPAETISWLREARDHIRALLDERVAAKRELDAAREAFNRANHDGPIYDWPEFREAEAAAKKVRAVEERFVGHAQTAAEAIYTPLIDD